MCKNADSSAEVPTRPEAPGILEGARETMEYTIDLEQYADALETENAQLRDELREWLEAYVYQAAELETIGEREGYYDSMGSSSTFSAMKQLEALGFWQRHPNGVDRRWWFRPKKESNDGV